MKKLKELKKMFLSFIENQKYKTKQRFVIEEKISKVIEEKISKVIEEITNIRSDFEKNLTILKNYKNYFPTVLDEEILMSELNNSFSNIDEANKTLEDYKEEYSQFKNKYHKEFNYISLEREANEFNDNFLLRKKIINFDIKEIAKINEINRGYEGLEIIDEHSIIYFKKKLAELKPILKVENRFNSSTLDVHLRKAMDELNGFEALITKSLLQVKEEADLIIQMSSSTDYLVFLISNLFKKYENCNLNDNDFDGLYKKARRIYSDFQLDLESTKDYHKKEALLLNSIIQIKLIEKTLNALSLQAQSFLLKEYTDKVNSLRFILAQEAAQKRKKKLQESIF